MRDSFMIPALQQWSEFLDELGAAEPEGLFKPYIEVFISEDISGTTHVFEGKHEQQIDNANLDMEFEIPFDDDPIPNEAELLVFNLSDSSIANIVAGKILSISFSYNNDPGVIFVGRISRAETYWEGPDRITRIFANDTGAYQDNIETTYAEGSTASFILEDLCAQSALPIAEFETLSDRTFEEAVTVEGNLGSAIVDYAEMCGVKAYVVRGQLYVRDIYKAPEDSITINETTGLIGSPSKFTKEETDKSVEDDSEAKITYSGYTFKSLLNHRIMPGAGARLESVNDQGNYVVKEGRHSFDGINSITECTVVDYSEVNRTSG